MLRMNHRLTWIGLLAAVATAAAFAGWWSFGERTQPHVAVRTSAPSSFTAATGNAVGARGFGPDMQSFSLRGRFHDRAGNGYSVGQARNANPVGECVVVAAAAGDTGSACDEPRLFSSGPVAWIEGFEGGPAPKDRTSEYVAGIAAPQVKAIDFVDSAGVTRRAPLSSGNAFFFTLPPEELARGVYIGHLSALAANGSLLRQIPLDDAR